MKIRTGFVSNSSSSSYIVTIKNTSMDEFRRFMMEGVYSIDDLDMPYLREKIEEELRGIRECERAHSCLYLSNFRKDRLIKILDKINQLCVSEDKSEYSPVDIALEYSEINIKEEDGNIVLEDYTSMHNNFVEGMNKLMQEIVLSYSFDTDKVIECKRESDNG